MFDKLKSEIVLNFIKSFIKQQRKENPMFKKIWDFLEGHKTTMVMITTVTLGAIDAANQVGLIHYNIPNQVYVLLGGLGWYTRAIAKTPGVLVK